MKNDRRLGIFKVKGLGRSEFKKGSNGITLHKQAKLLSDLLNENWSARCRIPFHVLLVKETQEVSKPTQALSLSLVTNSNYNYTVHLYC